MARTNHRNYYRLLHVQQDAPPEVLRASYRTLMQTLKNHPDLGGDEWKATLINEAHAVLSVAAAREQYDRERMGFQRGCGQTAEASSTAVPAGSRRESSGRRDAYLRVLSYDELSWPRGPRARMRWVRCTP